VISNATLTATKLAIFHLSEIGTTVNTANQIENVTAIAIPHAFFDMLESRMSQFAPAQ
jgi:class 3 adenylate cyclase